MADTPILIRSAVSGDAEVIAVFCERLAQETEGLTLDAATVRRGVRAALDDGAKGRYFVAEVDGRPVGVLLTTYEWSDWRDSLYLWIQSVYVDTAYRGRGVFRRLYDHVAGLVGRDGICGLRLYAHAENEGAIQTYRRLGMRHYGYRVFETADPLRPEE
jgi:ribosomal protein S18 acetylase RimI-like enzyme